MLISNAINRKTSVAVIKQITVGPISYKNNVTVIFNFFISTVLPSLQKVHRLTVGPYGVKAIGKFNSNKVCVKIGL